MATERLRTQLMQDRDLYPTLPLQADPRFGPIPGVPVGTSFENRRECYLAGLHLKVFAGISGTSALGAFSIVLSDGYEDDCDQGEFFTYTGTGGRVNSFSGVGSQTSDQSFDHPNNMTLKKSVETKRPVRVVRGPNVRSKYAPKSGYRYDGLYRVEWAYIDKGKNGYIVCKYDLRREPGQPPIPEIYDT